MTTARAVTMVAAAAMTGARRITLGVRHRPPVAQFVRQQWLSEALPAKSPGTGLGRRPVST
ncbi:hypothetical protein ACWGI8_21510 [Streptomyces sp. NPDC054841]